MTSGLSMISWPEAFKSHFVSSYGTPSKSLDNPGFKHNSSSVYALFYPSKSKMNKTGKISPKLAWSRDVTGMVDNIYSNLTETRGGQPPFSKRVAFAPFDT